MWYWIRSLSSRTTLSTGSRLDLQFITVGRIAVIDGNVTFRLYWRLCCWTFCLGFCLGNLGWRLCYLNFCLRFCLSNVGWRLGCFMWCFACLHVLCRHDCNFPNRKGTKKVKCLNVSMATLEILETLRVQRGFELLG